MGKFDVMLCVVYISRCLVELIFYFGVFVRLLIIYVHVEVVNCIISWNIPCQHSPRGSRARTRQ
jgi:hypothetical protein